MTLYSMFIWVYPNPLCQMFAMTEVALCCLPMQQKSSESCRQYQR
jgi:hypothetical protein